MSGMFMPLNFDSNLCIWMLMPKAGYEYSAFIIISGFLEGKEGPNSKRLIEVKE